jgi:hypothetical protein
MSPAVGARGGSGPAATTAAASPPRTTLRSSVHPSTGSSDSCPKQWQLGARPRASWTPIATMNAASSVSAPTAAHQAVGAGTSDRPTPSSAHGSTTAIGPASAAGTPRPVTAWRVPARSRSLVAAASRKTSDRTRRTSSRDDMGGPPRQRWVNGCSRRRLGRPCPPRNTGRRSTANPAGSNRPAGSSCPHRAGSRSRCWSRRSRRPCSNRRGRCCSIASGFITPRYASRSNMAGYHDPVIASDPTDAAMSTTKAS